jgi:CPA2 family monovalent cation:H+ antiporter-2
MTFLAGLSQEMNVFMAVAVVVFVIGLILKRYNQPYIIAYILCGVLLGPHGLRLVTNIEDAQQIGDVGIIILMFFIGMEISLPDFVSRWRVAFFGTGMQVLLSVGVVALLGTFLDWGLNRIILLGFIITISSSAVVIKLIESAGRPKNKLDDSIISILLTQDVIVVPMLITISLLGGSEVQTSHLVLQLIGGTLIVLALVYLFRKKTIKIPFNDVLKTDYELQIFAALIICFGCALAVSLFHLSASLGALVAGVFINSSNSCSWLHHSLASFRVILVSFFFISVGMLVDLDFMKWNMLTIIFMVLIVFIVNQAVNTVSLKSLGNDWKQSLYGGAFLSQIGEFSFVLASAGFAEGIIAEFTYQLTVIVIAITIFISPFWIGLMKKLSKV